MILIFQDVEIKHSLLSGANIQDDLPLDESSVVGQLAASYIKTERRLLN